ncbi:hypothetical protein [Bacillus sp. 1P02SD]|uniref:hypothetical protein n=1 Tax=Bacillus sp. 1P02SD TaxID=3132264 RepID=UPI00399F9915
MKKFIILLIALLLISGCTRYENGKPVTEETPKQTQDDVQKNKDDSTPEEETKETDPIVEAEANALEFPAKPGAMLYDKTEEKFKGMNYHFKGELVKIEKVEGITSLENAFLVKNEQGYIMPIFPPYEMTATEGDEIEVWGPLSGDGYASADLGVDNVVGVAGAMNATKVTINGEVQ